jgi:predicted transcriptional regulator
VRVTLTRQGAIWAETRVSLRQFDGVWFPELVEHYVKGWKGGTEPRDVIRVLAAEFNRSDHAIDFTPQDIGVEPGAFVSLLDASLKPVAHGTYDGTGFLTFAERRARAEAAKAASAGAEQAGRSVAERYAAALQAETEWEAYTRKFIERYGLTDEQAEQAWRICRACQDSARDYARRHEQPLAQLREQLAREAAEPDDGRRAQAALDARLLSIAKRVQDIFDNQLKPRLEKLPTREQRRAVEQREPRGEPPAGSRTAAP